MTGSKFIAWMAAAVAVMGAHGLSLGPANAAENAPEAKEAAPAPHTPIRIKTIDFQPAEQGPGKLKLAGTAAPGTTIYLFIDLDPYAKVVADGDGKWSLEGDLELTGDQHRLRAEQYDPETRMLAGRAMVTISRNAGAKP